MATDSFYAIAVDPAHPTYVFAGRNGPKVYRSADSGASWSDVSSGIVNYGPNCGVNPDPRRSSAETAQIQAPNPRK